MTNEELIAAVADDANVPKVAAKCVLDALKNVVAQQLMHCSEVTLFGFGKFKLAVRKATEGRNPRTGEQIHIPMKRVAKFSAAKALTDRLNALLLAISILAAAVGSAQAQVTPNANQVTWIKAIDINGCLGFELGMSPTKYAIYRGDPTFENSMMNLYASFNAWMLGANSLATVVQQQVLVG